MPNNSQKIEAPEPFLPLVENRFAVAAVTGLEINDTTSRRRPVYLYGPAGVGKSHLVSQVAYRLNCRHPTVICQKLTASQFAADFSEAVVNRIIPLFQAATRRLDLFILEDLQGLEARPESQIQLLALVDELAAQGCQIVWTCHKPAGELRAFLPKLISRFRSGVTAHLRLPGSASRLILLEHFARSRQAGISAMAAQLLADALAVSPRELQSTVQQIATLARHERRPIDTDMVRKFLAHDEPPPRIKLDDICRAVARQFGVSSGEVRSRNRTRAVALPRQCAMYLARELTVSSHAQIGRFFGGRDHTTVVHACRRIADLRQTELTLELHLNHVRASLGAAPTETSGDEL